MREIKFRGKAIKTKDWVYGYAVKRGSEWFIDYETTDWKSMPPLGKIEYHKVKVEEKTIGQYTGLKDKAGKEIYEGDVLKVPDFYESPESTSETYHYENVYFERGSFRTDNGIGDEDWDYISEECEVIGNIYENPELVETK